MTQRPRRRPAQRTRSARLPLLATLLLASACGPAPGALEVSVFDAASGRPTPVRVELLDAQGVGHVADDAMLLKTECWATPPPDWASSLVTTRSLENPHTGTTQFYADGKFTASLPPGRYTLAIYKGIEHEVERREVEIGPGESTSLAVRMRRWSDVSDDDWYAADDHLHITRMSKEDDQLIGPWMRAEDLDIANLLQMGTAEHFGITPQYAFGDEGLHHDGTTLLVSGQEHPRTHVLGHTITLAADAQIDLRDHYVLYQRFWNESKRLRGASGYAHWGEGNALNGLAIDAPSGLIHFMEVLQFEFPHYEIWYQLLNLGARIAPTGGTDFPCIPSVPGRERFYARVPVHLTRSGFTDAIREGRTFATNGPLLEFRVNGAHIGDELRLGEPGLVEVRGIARFDPTRDDVQRLELVRDGDVVATSTERRADGEIVLERELEVTGPTWFALRASGEKLGEARLTTPWFLEADALEAGCAVGCGASLHARAKYVGEGRARPSAAHTGAIWATVGDAAWRPSDAVLDLWLSRLDEFEARLSDERLDELLVWRPFSSVLLIDGVPEDALRADRKRLLRLIGKARHEYGKLRDGAG